MNPFFPQIMPPVVTFAEMLYGLARSLGMSPEEEGLQRSIAHQMTEGINTAHKVCWQFSDWPQACPTIKVSLTEQDGRKILPAKAGNLWVGELLGVTSTAGHPLPYQIIPGGYQFPGLTDDEINILYRPPAPKFTAVQHDQTKTYRPGALVWDDVDTGHVYICMTAVTVPGTALSSEPHWQPVPVLEMLVEATKTGAKALYLQTEAQFSAAQIVEQAVLGLLEHEIQLIHNQQGHNRTYRR